MRIHIISDLHLDFFHNYAAICHDKLIPWGGDVLIIAGDTCESRHRKPAKSFFDEISKHYKLIIEVPGNHDFYGSSTKSNKFHEYEKVLNGNHYYVNNKTIIFDNVRFICSTLWSYISPRNAPFVLYNINDYHQIEDHTIERNNRFHLNNVSFIEKELKTPFVGKTIVVSHHLPTLNCIHEKYVGSQLNDAFCNDLSRLLRSYTIDYWIAGHTHSTINLIEDKTNIIVNPVGYVHLQEHLDFKPDMYVNI